jgi:hypothetical protein
MVVLLFLLDSEAVSRVYGHWALPGRREVVWHRLDRDHLAKGDVEIGVRDPGVLGSLPTLRDFDGEQCPKCLHNVSAE